MNYSQGFKGNRIVRTSNGGGVQEIDFPNNATKIFILDEAKNIFFLNGKSSVGDIMKFKIELGSFQGHLICEEFILGNYLKQQKL